MKGFIEFIRSQGVVGLAVGFIMGGSITKLITAFVNDIINPIVGIFMGAADLQGSYIQIAGAKIMWGSFISNLIDFIIMAFIVYFSVQILGLNRLDKDKNKK
jgi:large conductance mechanosensitive channel